MNSYSAPEKVSIPNTELCLFVHFSYYVAGDIHIWDQESGALLHHVRVQANGGDLTCIAWNHAFEDPFMFATGSHDGAVRIWTKRPEEPDDELAYHDPGITGADILRTNSPFELLEHERRSDCMLTHQDLDSMHESSSDSAAHLLRDRVAALIPRRDTT
jgi:WD40 repeat protein